ncbi:MAG TPA: PAS domain S-box protein, partial [Polyangiales bacterium]|nr:PAS domain S-box protein [Polyangiales bacterium]
EVVRSTGDAVITMTLAGTITSWNPGAERILGYAAHEVVGKSVLMLIPLERADEETLVLSKVARGERVEALETVRMRKDGQRTNLSVAVSPLQDNSGRIVGAAKVLRDISERKRAEQAARASEDRIAALEQHSWDAVHLLSVDGVILYESPSVIRVLGYTPEELVGRNSFELIHPDDVARVGELFGPLATSPGLTLTAEVRVRHKDGSWPWMDCVATNLLEHPAVRAIAVNYRDITVRKESEKHFRFLNDLSEATRTLIDPEQIMAVTARMLGGHLHVSRCAYADVEKDGERFSILHDYTDGCRSTVGSYQLSLFGPRAVTTLYSGQTLIIRNVEEELSPAEGADMFNAIGIKAIITCPLIKDGALRAMMAVHQTTPRAWQPREIAVVQDVVERCWATLERRSAEEKLQQLNTELEQRVAERTSALEEANKELEAFSYSVSHDLRAPLRTLDGFSQALIEDYGPQLPAEAKRYLQTIRAGAQRMATLIDDLLAFAHVSRQSLTKRCVDTNSMVRTALTELEESAHGRELEVRIGELPPCEGDPALLKQVWFNLLSNALKYTRKCHPAIVEAGCDRDRGTNTYFVRDNGAGFDMKYVHKLFGVFQRLHRAEDYEGTGVGLAIVQRVIRRHGGRIWAEATEGHGATFHFTLEPEIEL